MTLKLPGVVLIEPEDDETCEDCGNVDETRPYGPGGKRVCFDCMMKDEDGAKERFYAMMDNEDADA